jgi:cytochrome c peroxidase
MRSLVVVGVVTAVAALGVVSLGLAESPDPAIATVGESLYFDENLSIKKGQSCASCHDPVFGFDDPDSDLPVSGGVLPRRFGNRNSPISAYAMYAPVFHFDEGENLWIGGQFWDGRATGYVLGDPLADQALGPFLNSVEMANPTKETVVMAVRQSDYADDFEAVFGPGSLDSVEIAYDYIALAIAAFERTPLFAQFSSKYDAYLEACLDEAEFVTMDVMEACAKGTGDAAGVAAGFFSPQEWSGMELFMSEAEGGALCVACHVADWTQVSDSALPVVSPDWAPDGWVPPLFTDFTFDNLGVPKNPDNPWYDLPPNLNPDGEDWIDYGLGEALKNSGYPSERYEGEMGKVKVMTLRNIGVSAPYMHNGFFDDLTEVVHFYNTRDNQDFVWPAPEVPQNVNTDELGDLGLSPEQESDIAAFLMTLTDGWEGP